MPKMTPPKSGVKIRLYRQFLGDCILLAFPTSIEDEAFYILIDCGAFASAPLEAVANDIVESTGGEIDVVVMTHEHQDHLSGFGYAKPKEIFQDTDKVKFRELWMAWTESKTDKLAKDLRKEVSFGMQALETTAKTLKSMSLAIGDEILELMETSFAKTIDEARKNLLALVPNAAKNHKTWSPGDWCEPLGNGGPRVYFLGPPKDRDFLRTNEVAGEHYDPNKFAIVSAFHSAILAFASGDPGLDESRPFRRDFAIGVDDAKEDPVLATQYFGSDSSCADPDEVPPGAAWRRIELDWFNQASELALQYDDYINNTSLVMAIELPESGKVILLPGDAQGGNWQSWSDETKGLIPKFDIHGEKKTSVDLLRRTVFYKVSHHGSHNGTLRTGLEELGTKMNDGDLVAMIPTDEMYAWTKKTAGQWKMPYLPLYKRLLEKTKGRVIQGDIGLPDKKKKNTTPHPNSKFKDKPPYTDSLWKEVTALIKNFQNEIDEFRASSDVYREEELYFEYTVLDE